VFLKVMSFPRDIRGNLDPVGETHPGNFSQSGVGFLGCRGVNANTNSTPLGATLKGRRRTFIDAA
jgi:hypothetical protein